MSVLSALRLARPSLRVARLSRRRLLSLLGTGLVLGLLAPADLLAADETPPTGAAPQVQDGGQIAWSERALGSPDAPITMFEYSSLTCPHCADFHREVLPQLEKDFIETGKVRLVFRDFPLDNLARGAALIGRCVPEKSYFRFIGILFENQADWARDANPLARLSGYARLSGLSKEGLDACLDNKELFTTIGMVQEDAAKNLGIDGTPAFVIDGAVHSGFRDYDYFAKLFNTLLKAKEQN